MPLLSFSYKELFDNVSNIEEHVDIEILFESYLRDVLNINNQLEMLIERVTNTQSLLDTRLNAVRNRLLCADMIISILSLTFATVAAVGGVFGMNLISGYEESDNAFYVVTIVSLGTSFLILLIAMICLKKEGLFQI